MSSPATRHLIPSERTSSVNSCSTTVSVDRGNNRLDDRGKRVTTDEVHDSHGVAHTISRGDLVRINSKKSKWYQQVGHVSGFTGRRIRVYLTNLNYSMTFNAENLEFMCFEDDPMGVTYHQKWKNKFNYSSSDEDSEDEEASEDSEDEKVFEVSEDDDNLNDHHNGLQPFRCVIL